MGDESIDEEHHDNRAAKQSCSSKTRRGHLVNQTEYEFRGRSV
jgi:hypothetical protein